MGYKNFPGYPLQKKKRDANETAITKNGLFDTVTKNRHFYQGGNEQIPNLNINPDTGFTKHHIKPLQKLRK